MSRAAASLGRGRVSFFLPGWCIGLFCSGGCFVLSDFLMFHSAEIRWLGSYSPSKPPFGVRSSEVFVGLAERENSFLGGSLC